MLSAAPSFRSSPPFSLRTLHWYPPGSPLLVGSSADSPEGFHPVASSQMSVLPRSHHWGTLSPHFLPHSGRLLHSQDFISHLFAGDAHTGLQPRLFSRASSPGPAALQTGPLRCFSGSRCSAHCLHLRSRTARFPGPALPRHRPNQIHCCL